MAVRLSEDKELVQEIKEKLQENNGYCPCRIERTEDTKCPCKEFRELEEGECHCGLFVKTKENVNTMKSQDIEKAKDSVYATHIDETLAQDLENDYTSVPFYFANQKNHNS